MQLMGDQRMYFQVMGDHTMYFHVMGDHAMHIHETVSSAPKAGLSQQHRPRSASMRSLQQTGSIQAVAGQFQKRARPFNAARPAFCRSGFSREPILP
ncbi:hypothetical protein C7S18_14000 [Ahniella affigens]|uniref:Uncharacterized protein n=1 Tax=Ahniella affigens TaxID=2021234 RepID=A0A2P1PTR1_9GAMM|nr:hypothetical protein C7S18_14000 [Ahniella affigens]